MVNSDFGYMSSNWKQAPFFDNLEHGWFLYNSEVTEQKRPPVNEKNGWEGALFSAKIKRSKWRVIIVVSDLYFPISIFPIWMFSICISDLYFSDLYFPICVSRIRCRDLYLPICLFRFGMSWFLLSNSYDPLFFVDYFYSTCIFRIVFPVV